MEKLYIVTRSDLAPGARLAQSCHALRAFVAAHPELDRQWYAGSESTIVCLEAEHEASLTELAKNATAAGFAVATFHEPDFGNELTAIGLEGNGWRLVSSLPLALRPRTPIRKVTPKPPTLWQRLWSRLAA